MSSTQTTFNYNPGVRSGRSVDYDIFTAGYGDQTLLCALRGVLWEPSERLYGQRLEILIPGYPVGKTSPIDYRESKNFRVRYSAVPIDELAPVVLVQFNTNFSTPAMLVQRIREFPHSQKKFMWGGDRPTREVRDDFIALAEKLGESGIEVLRWSQKGNRTLGYGLFDLTAFEMIEEPDFEITS